MIGLVLGAYAFDPGTVMPAPRTPFVSVSEQVVFSRTTLGFTRLDAGLPVIGFSDRFTVGATVRVVATSAGTKGQPTHVGLRDLVGGVWFGVNGGPRVHHGFGVTFGGPLAGTASTYGLLVAEASRAPGTGYRMHASLEAIDVDVSVNANLNTVTVFGADVGATVTGKLWEDRLGLQIGGLAGLSEVAWLTGGVRVRPIPELELGATALLGLPLDSTGPVHVSPLVLVRVQPRKPRAAVEIRPVMEPAPLGG